MEWSYLGHIMTLDGVKSNPYKNKKKIKEYMEFQDNQGIRGNLDDVRQLMIMKLLTLCLEKEHSTPSILCFDNYKNALTHKPIVQNSDFFKLFPLTTNASNVRIAEILSQGPMENDKPIAYILRILTQNEKKIACYCLGH